MSDESSVNYWGGSDFWGGNGCAPLSCGGECIIITKQTCLDGASNLQIKASIVPRPYSSTHHLV